MAQAPTSALVPNAWARQRGLTLAVTFNGNTARPYLTNGAVEAAFAGGSAPGLSAGAPGMVGTAGYWQATSGQPTYNLPTGRGTVVVAARSMAASGTGQRYLFSAGYLTGFPASPFFGLADFTGSIAAGWANSGTDGRISVSSVGGAMWAAGDSPVLAVSYGAAGQTLYVNGIQKGTSAFAGYGNTSGGIFAVGQLDGFGAPWLTAAGDAIYYVLAFDQELKPNEIAALAADPWLWARPSRRRRVAAAGVTVALTGVSATGAVGTLGPQTAVAVTGVTGTGAVGTLAPSLAVALTGVTATAAVGDVGIGGDKTVALTGVSATGVVGDVGIGATLVDTHDGWVKRSRRERRLDALRARLDEERLADARALRAALEAALDDAQEVPAPKVVAAVQAAPKPQEIDWQRVAQRDEEYARLSRKVTRLAAVVAAEARQYSDDDDDEEAIFLMGMA